MLHWKFWNIIQYSWSEKAFAWKMNHTESGKTSTKEFIIKANEFYEKNVCRKIENWSTFETKKYND